MIALLLLAAQAPAPQPGDLKTFGDWTVGCDNVARCTATTLIPEAEMGDDIAGAAMIDVTRDAGPHAAPTLSIELRANLSGPHSFVIGGKTVARRTIAANAGQVDFTAPEATALIAAMASGRVLEVRNAQGAAIARISLAGSSAALRYIDDRQGRANTVTALVAKGKKPASAVPPESALPVIAAAPSRPRAAFKATAKEIAKLRADTGCTDDEADFATAETSALDVTHSLILLSCGHGAYNFSSAPFIARQTRVARSIVPARFDYAVGWGPEGGPTLLVNADWDAKTRTLRSYAKGRGLGDCGSAENFAWDGARFRLTEARAMGECRGSINWIVLWRARVARK